MPLLLSFLIPTLTYGAAAVAVYAFGATIASGVIWIGATILGVVAMLFDTLILYTIVNFHTFIYPAIQDGINITWTVGRDIANIVIIGVFTYVGISTILGGQSFGAKSLMARVLIIAMLINFSLFFTQVIIFTSNFVASKFYYATVPSVATNTTTSDGGLPTEETQAGIAGRFMELAGLPSLSRAGETTQAIREQHDYGFWMALLYGFSVFTMCIAFAGVLFYASILLIARTILFFIILITSSLAFGTHLIPKISDNYGWSMWWSALLRNAVFAPLLLIMLWATFRVSESFVRAQGSTRSFDKLFLGQGDSSGILALFFYLVVLGMLYASVRIASMFAAKIPMFNWSSTLPVLSAGILGQAIAFGGRQSVGRSAAWAGRRLQEASKDTTKPLWARQLYDFNAQKFKGIGKSEMNVMRGTLGKELQGIAGFKKLDAIAGKQVKGFEASQKARAEKFATQADRMKLSDEETKKMTTKAIQQVMAENPELGKEHDDTKTATEASQAGVKRLVEQQQQSVDEFAKQMKTLTTDLNNAQARAQQNPSDPTAHDEVSRLQRQVEQARADHKSSLNEQEKRIADAKLISDHDQRALAQVLEKGVKKAIDEGIYPKSPTELAEDIAHRRFSNTLARATGLSKKESDQLVGLTKDLVKDKKKKQGIKDAIAELRKAEKEEGGGSTEAKSDTKKDAH